MAAIAVVGAGMMGSAMCVPLADRGHDVHLVGTPLDESIIVALRESGRHPGLGVALPGVHFHSVSGLARALEGADAIVLGVSSAGVSWAAAELAPLLGARAGLPVLMLTKGLEHDAGGVRVLSDSFAQRVAHAAPGCSPAVVCGPCIAGELARRVPTMVVLTGRELNVARVFADWLACDYYHPRLSRDVVGAQVCAAVKNAYAMGVAFAAGLHERRGGGSGSVAMHNYEAAVFARAIVEMGSLVAALGGAPESAWGLAGSGDLTVTCNGGRTGRFGALLGRGLGVPEARDVMRGATLECLEVLAVLEQALAAGALGRLQRADLPLLAHLFDVALHGAAVDMPWAELFRA